MMFTRRWIAKEAGVRFSGLLALLLWLVSGQPALAQQAPVALAMEFMQSMDAEEGELDWEALNRFYTTARYEPVWLDSSGPNVKARLLREHWLRAERDGLAPRHYLTPAIERLWSATDHSTRMQLELRLSNAFFDYSRDLRRGRVMPQQAAPLWLIERQESDPVRLLQLVLVSGDFESALQSLAPPHAGYRRLRDALARYRAIAASGGWPEVAAGPLLRPGDQGARVASLRRRLAAEGDLPLFVGEPDTRFDPGLGFAVRRFQVRHGLQVDGVVGPATLAELNQPVKQRIEQILLAMERWRWLPETLGWRHIIVNIPAFELVAYQAGEARLAMPVIIGTERRPTPVISGQMHTVVLNPDWTVPRSIALKDLLPRQRRDSGYLASQRIRVFRNWDGEVEVDPAEVPWEQLGSDNFPYMLRQDPGPKNALGRVKFLFYNRNNVYLHDTPHSGLFASAERAYSSGCIRLEEPLRLADFVLSAERQWPWDQDTVQAVIDSGVTFEVPLAERLPVYLLYLTAWVGEDGAVNFRPDVYGEDALLAPCIPTAEP